MPTQVQFRRGTTAQNNSFTGAAGEITVNTSNATVRVHDGVTLGGSELATTASITSSIQVKANVADLTTANVTEITNLYFSNARVYSNVSQIGYATTTYVTNELANLVNSAPATLDTLNELANALGDDPNFATSTATLIGNASNQANAAYARANVAIDSLTTSNVVELNNLYFSNARVYSNVISIGYATTANTLSQFASTTSAELSSLISDETGTGNLVFSASPTFTGNVDVTGNINATQYITSPFFYSESDMVLKENIVAITNPVDKILNLFGVNFDWKSNKTKGVGVIAQDVEKVMPEAVSVNSNGNKIVSYSSLIPLLIEAVKEQQNEIKNLKKLIENK